MHDREANPPADWDRERIRRAVEDGEYVGDVAPLLAAEVRRLRVARLRWKRIAEFYLILFLTWTFLLACVVFLRVRP